MSVLDGSIVPVGHMGLTIGADARVHARNQSGARYSPC